MLGQALALDAAGDTLYLGGDFDRLGGFDLLNAGAVLKSTGQATSWDPALTGGDGVRGTTLAVKAGGSAVHLGGSFTRVGDRFQLFATAVDQESGARLELGSHAARFGRVAFTGFLYDIELLPKGAVLAGDFRELLGIPRSGLAAVTDLETEHGAPR